MKINLENIAQPLHVPEPPGSAWLLTCYVGSTLHGTSVDDGLEDVDYMSIIVEPPTYSSLGFRAQPDSTEYNEHNRQTFVQRTKPEGVRSEAGDVDHVLHTLRRYLALVLKNNPTMMLPLFAPPDAILQINEYGEELRALAPAIISKQVYATFNGYINAQEARLRGTLGQKNCTRPELIEKYGHDTKYAGHIIRLAYQGIELLATGRLTLPMPERQRQVVLDVRTGKVSLEEVYRIIARLRELLADALQASELPDKPDWAKVNRWMLNTYLDIWVNL